jgi:plasmid stabilization system protein ParE
VFSLLLQQEAIDDVNDAFVCYQMQHEGLGDEFLEALEKGFAKITNNPTHFGTYINERYRKMQIGTFLYLILFEIESNTVIVSAVRHAKRNIKY